MKRFLPVIIFVIALGGAYYYGHQPVANPDPNHNHADFAVWVNGQQLDFSGEEYMTEELTDAQLEALKTSTATGTSLQVLKQYLHLHDGNGHVIHRHKPGLTFGDFMRSIGVLDVTENGNLCITFSQGLKSCGDEASHRTWMMKLSTREYSDTTYDYGFDYNYAFQDDDKIFIILPSSEDWDEQMKEINAAWKQMTDDACLYSKTCPCRGDAPTEGCIADPTVPCTE